MKIGIFYNEDLDKDDRSISLNFNVHCNSPVSMQTGSTLEERIKFLINQCEEAIDREMRHWGDFYYDVECLDCTVLDENKNGNIIKNEINLDTL